ncbi:MAG: hypothetical protein HZC40_05050 [Chloroflexi bacterium]|nr:hypothetical protein [Chloroflexota bacterium]
MKIEKTGVMLEEAEMMELESILLDEDGKAALDFLKRLKRRIEILQRSHCGTMFGENLK